MNPYRVTTRQANRGDLQYYTRYCVWADDEQDARAYFQRRLKYAVIQDVSSVDTTNLLLLEC